MKKHLEALGLVVARLDTLEQTVQLGVGAESAHRHYEQTKPNSAHNSKTCTAGRTCKSLNRFNLRAGLPHARDTRLSGRRGVRRIQICGESPGDVVHQFELGELVSGQLEPGQARLE